MSPNGTSGPGSRSLLQRLGELNPLSPDFFNNSLKNATGYGYRELRNAGPEVYPNAAPGTAHHRLTSRMVTQALLDKIGGIPGVGETVAQAVPQVLGLGVEGWESLDSPSGILGHFRSPDTARDLGANAAGSRDAIEEYRRRRNPHAFSGGVFP